MIHEIKPVKQILEEMMSELQKLIQIWRFKMLEINQKSLTVPLIQGGMGVGVSLGSLAGHVAKCGAMGLFLQRIQDTRKMILKVIIVKQIFVL